MKKRSPKLKSTRKTEQDRPCQKFWLLVKSQRKKVKVNWFRVKINEYWSGSGHGSNSGAADVILWRGLGLTLICLRGCWRGLMMSSGDVRWHQQLISACGRRVLSLPAREGDARNPRGAWGAWQVLMARGGAWSVWSWGRNFSWHVEARVMQFLAVLGWVLLGIGCSVFLCLFFGS